MVITPHIRAIALILWLFTTNCPDTTAQIPENPQPHSFTLTGRVTDTIGQALSPATVTYLSEHDTLRTFTSANGTFQITAPFCQKFRISITMKGYISYSNTFHIQNSVTTLQLPTCTLPIDYLGLDPVDVVGIRSITRKGDTLTYRLKAFPVRDGSAIIDVLKRFPGMEVDINGNVVIQGKAITSVLVNGKTFFGNDVLLAIQNLPANIVDKIQVIDDFGDKARLTGVRSGEASKILNLVLEPDKQNGLFGSIEAGEGNHDKYAADAFANAFKGERQLSAKANVHDNSPAGSDHTWQGALSYANQWNPRWVGSLDAASVTQAPHSTNSTTQDTYYPGDTLQQTQISQTGARNSQTNIEGKLVYKPDNNSTIRLNASAVQQQSNDQSDTRFTTFQSDSGYTKSSNGSAVNNSQSTGQNLTANLTYEKFSATSRRRFTVEGGVGYNSGNTTTNNQSTATEVIDSSSVLTYVHDLTTTNTRTWNTHLNSTYFLPVGRTAFVELGYRVQTDLSHTNTITQQPDSGNNIMVIIDSLSQHMTLRTLTQDIRAAYSAKFYQFDFTSALDAQPGSQQGTVDTKGHIISYAYFALIPNLEAAWTIDNSRRLNLNYSSGPNLPDLPQLAPFTNITNPQYPVTGNPQLKPSHTDNLGLHYEQSALHPTRSFGFGLGVTYSSTRHPILQNLTSPKDSSQVIQAATYVNAGTTHSLNTNYHLMMPTFFQKRLRINIDGNLVHNQAITMTNGIQYPNQAWTWNQSIHLQVLIPDILESDLSGNYALTRNTYTASNHPVNTFRSASLVLKSRHYFLRHWILNYQLSQPYTSSGSQLQTAPADLTASLQRQFLPHHSATLGLIVYNLLNHSTAMGQSVSPTTLTENRSDLIGRCFLLSFQWKFQRFRQ